MANTPPSGQPERRQNPELRSRFEQAYDILEPFFNNDDNRWNGRTLDQFAYLALRDGMPQLSKQECFILVMAAKRVFAERRYQP